MFKCSQARNSANSESGAKIKKIGKGRKKKNAIKEQSVRQVEAQEG